MSMLDLMIAVAIGAILLATGAPTFSSTAQKSQIKTAASQLHMSMSLARNEAVKRRRAVRVCPSADSSSCRNDGEWGGGWLVFEDANSNSSPDTSEIITLVDSLEHGIDIAVSNAMSDYVQFQPTGAAIGGGGMNGVFRVCHSDSTSHSMVLQVSGAGRVELFDGQPTDCSEEA
ncbi:MAG: hypothetical protein HKP19_02440 [Xanthomonadales bacterium]|nr:hypothetical protein [Xanthomonadales bacterium]